MNREISRRQFIQLSSATLTGMALAGCAAATPQAAPAEAPAAEAIELVYIGADESGAGEVAFKVYTDQVIPPFEEAHPGIRVTFQPALGSWTDALIASAAAGTAPDIFPHWAAFGRRLMEDGQTLPLQDYIPQEVVDDFLEQQIIACKLDGDLLALPRYISSIALAYNKDMLDEAGVAYPDESWTWDTLLEALAKLGDMGTSERGKLFPYYFNYFYPWEYVWQNGAEWMDKEIMGTQILIDEPKALQALQFYHDIVFKYGYSAKATDMEGLGWYDMWPTGRIAIVEGHSWQVSQFISTSDWNWDYAVLPAGPVKRAGVVFNDNQSVYAKTQHPSEACLLMNYISSPEVERIMMLSVHGWQPSRKSMIEEWNTTSTGAKAGKNVQAFSQILDFSRQDPYFVQNAGVRDIYDPLWERIWVTADLGLEEGVNEIVSRVNEFLATAV